MLAIVVPTRGNIVDLMITTNENLVEDLSITRAF